MSTPYEIDRAGHRNLDAEIDDAVRSGGLVLVERPREIYWRGLPIDVDWVTKNVLFLYLSTLIRQAQFNRPLDVTHLGEYVQANALKNWKYRLRKEPGFPRSLADLIRPVHRGQRLDVPPDKIHIFESALN